MINRYSDQMGYYAGPDFFEPRWTVAETAHLIRADFPNHPTLAGGYVLEFTNLARALPSVRDMAPIAMLKYHRLMGGSGIFSWRMIWWDGARYVIQRMHSEFDIQPPDVYDPFKSVRDGWAAIAEKVGELELRA